LRPGGVFANALSERWFPPKVIRLRVELLRFERLGLALESYHRGGPVGDLQTETVRGLSRPTDDKYAATLAYSGLVNAAWGMRRSDEQGRPRGSPRVVRKAIDHGTLRPRPAAAHAGLSTRFTCAVRVGGARGPWCSLYQRVTRAAWSLPSVG